MHYLSVSWHIISLEFSSWNMKSWKEPIKVQIFRFLSALMKVHPIPHTSFETTKSRFIHLSYHWSVSWKVTPLYFFISNLYTLDKRSPSKWNFQTFDWLVKIHQIPYVMFETASQFFFKLCITFQFHER